MCHTSGIRSVVAVLITVLTVVVAIQSIVPAAQARPNDGRYQKSQEAKRKKLQKKCDDLHSSYDNLGILFDQEIAQHDVSSASSTLIALSDIKDQAAKSGCGWAKRVMPPQPPDQHPTAPSSVLTAAG